MAEIKKGSRARVYVLRGLVQTRPTVDPYVNAALDMLGERYDDLPEWLRDWVDDYRGDVDDKHAEVRAWAHTFYKAYSSDSQFVPDRRGKAHRKDDRADWTTMMVALGALIDAGHDGVTAHEVKKSTGVISDGISGSLATLHKARVAARLEEQR